MGDESVLLDHARRYFAQASQSSDIRKIRMLVELGLEFLRLAQHDQAQTRAGTTEPATDAAASTARDEDNDADDTRT